MAKAHQRKKDPTAVRANLLAAAENLAAERGLPAVTMQAVSAASGVTKGGLIHHFATKDALLDALFDTYIRRFDALLDRLIDADTTPHGRFSRAYIRATLDPAATRDFPMSSDVVVAFLGEPALRRKWCNWITTQEARHRDTDPTPAQKIARYAADGLWCALIEGPTGDDAAALLPDLLAMTRTA